MGAMLVCHCHAVNDRQIAEEIGAGAHCVDVVGERCGAGTRCGGCRLAIARMVEVHLASRLAA